LHLDVSRQQLREHFLRRRLEQILGLRTGPGSRRLGLLDVPPRDRQERLHDNALRHDRAELVVDELHAVDPSVDERLDGRIGDALGIVEFQGREDVHLLEQHCESAATEVVAAAPSHEPERDLPRRTLDDEGAGGLDRVGVEAAAKSAVGGDDDQERLATGARRRARIQQRVLRGVHARRDAREHAAHLARERPRVLDALLRATEPRRGDHLHGFGDLLCRFHSSHAPADI
jgi:hypothetical protein